MIRNLDLVNYIKEQLANDAPTTEIFESLDALANQSQNFDAGIFFLLNEESELTVNVAGDVASQSYPLAVRLLEPLNREIEAMVLEAEARLENGEVEQLDMVALAE